MSRRQFFADVRRHGRASVDSGGGSPHARSGSTDGDGVHLPSSSKRRSVTGSSKRKSVSGSGKRQSVSAGKESSMPAVEDLYTPLREPYDDPSSRPSSGTSSDHRPSSGGVLTDAYRADGHVASPTPTTHQHGANGGDSAAGLDPSRSRSNTAPYPAAAGGGATPHATLSGSDERSGSNATGQPSAFPLYHQPPPTPGTAERGISRSPATGISPRHGDPGPSAASTTSELTPRAINYGDALPQTYGRPIALPGAQMRSDDNTSFQTALDTPDHRDRRGLPARARSPVNVTPFTPPMEKRLTLDDPTQMQYGGDAAAARDRNSSIYRIEGSLVALQVDLANEKRNNIEAELTISSLHRAVEVLKTENRALAAGAAVSDGSADPPRMSGVGSAPSGKSVEELEQRVARLTRLLEVKQKELDDKEDRVRLLESKLADHLLSGGGFSMMPAGTSPPHQYQQQQQQQYQQQHSETVSLSSVQGGIPRGIIRNVTTPEIPSSVSGGASMGRPGPVRTAPSPAAVEYRTASPAPPRSDSASRRPSIRRRAPSIGGPPAAAPAARPRASSIQRRESSVSRPRAGSLPSSNLGAAQRASSAIPQSGRGVARKGSTASYLNASVASLPRRASSPVANHTFGSQRRMSTSSATSAPASAARNPTQPRRPSVTRRGSSGRRESTGHPGSLGSSHAATGTTGAPPTTVTTSGYSNSTLYQQPPALRPMMGHGARTAGSPARSATASMRSGTSTRSRPRITYDDRGDLATMQGTTTTVVFRSSSNGSRPRSVSNGYGVDYSHMRPAARDAPLVPSNADTSAVPDSAAVPGGDPSAKSPLDGEA